jgi:hypothetical protein
MVRSPEINACQLGVIKNGIVQIAILENRIHEIGSNKRNLFHRTGIETRFRHFLVGKRRIIQNAILKVYAKQEISTRLELNTQQFAVSEMYGFQTRSG